MLYVFLLLTVAAVAFMVKPVRAHVKFRRQTRGLTRMSRAVMRAYLTVPPESRPDIDVLSALRFIESQYGQQKINDHFGKPHFIRKQVRINVPSEGRHYYCRGKRCLYPDYEELYSPILALLAALDKQKHLMLAAGMTRNDLTATIETLNNEVEFVQDVNKEIAQ